MSRDVIEPPPTQRLYQRAGPGRPPANTTSTRYPLTASRHNGNFVDPLPLSLPPPTEDTYLLRSVADKKDVMVYIDDDARVHGKLCSDCPTSVTANLRSTSFCIVTSSSTSDDPRPQPAQDPSFCIIPPTPPPNVKRSSKGRQTSVESAPPTVRVGASLDLLSPSTGDAQLDETTPPLTPECVDRQLPKSSSYSRRGRYWAAVSDASETSDQPPSNWASFDLSLSDCPLRLVPSDTACDLTVASIDDSPSPTPMMSESVTAALNEFDPLSCAQKTEQPCALDPNCAG